MSKGYFGIGIYHPKSSVNVGTLFRHCNNFGAQFLFTIGKRYKTQASDTQNTHKNIPLLHYMTYEDMRAHLPYDCQVVTVELDSSSIKLNEFTHPKRCVYLLGAEDHGLPKSILEKSQHIVEIPTLHSNSMNVAVAGTILMYDRIIKTGEI